MARKNARVGDEVIVISGKPAGRMGTVVKLTSVKTDDPDVRLAQMIVRDSKGESFTINRSMVALVDSLSEAQVMGLTEQYEAFCKEIDAQFAAAERAREKRIRDEYIESRLPKHYFQRTHNREWENSTTISVDPFSVTEHHRELMSLTNQKNWMGQLSVTVNWSAIGSVTPEEALAFADSLKKLAEQAITIRAQREDEEGLTADIEAAIADFNRDHIAELTPEQRKELGYDA